MGVQVFVVILSILYMNAVQGQHYEDKRCRCVCPSISTIISSSTQYDRKLFIASVPPNQCNCYGVVLPSIGDLVEGRAQEYCPRCECKYEIRNTAVIKVVIIIIMWVLVSLVMYMGFLSCLYPLVKKRNPKSYEEYTTEECHNLLIRGEAAED